VASSFEKQAARGYLAIFQAANFAGWLPPDDARDRAGKNLASCSACPKMGCRSAESVCCALGRS